MVVFFDVSSSLTVQRGAPDFTLSGCLAPSRALIAPTQGDCMSHPQQESQTPDEAAGTAPPDEGFVSANDGERSSWRVMSAQPVTYDVRIVEDLLNPAEPALARAGTTERTGGRRLIVIESLVHALYGHALQRYFTAWGLTAEVLALPAEERVKTMDSVHTVTRHLDGLEIARRHEPIIAIGGGVLLDVVGMAASLYRRSTPYVRVPTTLIGLVDAGVGVKTGVNFDNRKNRLGTYYAPSTCLLDPSFLRSLDERHISNGLAEILKIALVKDYRLFTLLERHGGRLVTSRMQPDRNDSTVTWEVLERAIGGMLEELAPNLWEKELHRLVDYGHSFSPTIEMDALPELLHGEAVCLDMALTTAIAHGRGLVGDEDYQRIMATVDRLRLPAYHPICTVERLGAALADTVRHRDGAQRLPLPVGIGSAQFVDDVTVAEIGAALDRLAVAETGLAGASGAKEQRSSARCGH
jgi:3-dehydroquinate synthase